MIKKIFKFISISVAFIFLFSSTFVFAQSDATTSPITIPPVMGYCGFSLSPVPNSENFQIDWNASVFNMNASSSSYKWSGTDGLDETGFQITKIYNTPGQKIAQVDIVGDRQVVTLNCSANVPQLFRSDSIPPPISGSCQPLVNGMKINWTASVSGAGTPESTSFNWSGTDGLSGTSTQVIKIYTSPGLKTGTVNVRSGGQSLDLSCQALIASTTSGCFIATAAYGTPMEPQVMVLRHFRDETLLKTKAGQDFVAVYYKISPPIADVIREHDSLRAIVRFGLEPIIFTLEKSGYKA